MQVNCVDEGELCKKFDIAGYPTIKWGKRESFLQAFQGTDSSGVVNVQTAFRSAEAITDWINTKLHKNYILTIPKLYEAEKEKMQQLRQQAKTQAAATTIEPQSKPDVPPSPSFTDTRASLWDAEKAIYMVVDYIFETQVLDIHKRTVFFDFLDLLCAHFPTKSCKPSLCYFSSKMRQIWTPEATSVPLDVRVSPFYSHSSYTHTLCVGRKEFLEPLREGWGHLPQGCMACMQGKFPRSAGVPLWPVDTLPYPAGADSRHTPRC